MKVFIDSADVGEIREAFSMGVIDGCTTNPSLLAKTGRNIESVVNDICQFLKGPVSAEVIATQYGEILAEGRALARLHPNVVVKIPLIEDGLKAVRTFTQEGIKTNVTLCFSPAQALLAAKAGATYISPFVGRVDDIAWEGMELLKQIVTIYARYGFQVQVLAASIRHPVHVVQAAMMGVHCATLPFSVIKHLLKHPLTDIGLEKFLADAKGSEAKSHA
ncbi:fructose-6-phosphate aldolase [Pajaroellobacter abortibovis]|uniref:Probable transaldolase n=1 Tax=Pajaroellobacter abortibovis TaxID=1882918 RepID=A0A1L6MYM1_9BACT|nr:fructose-6-phosphate aldolase [Pajaroellobacter abortibovis]APS00612.1 fructose-6-phosphate aldolase [Pajaroellobacter abortibovis]